MKYILSDLRNMKKGKTVDIAVYNCFQGKIKIVKNRIYKWLVEIVNVSMCYPQQVQLRAGEQIWIYKKDLFRDNAERTYKKNRISFRKNKYDCELPF